MKQIRVYTGENEMRVLFIIVAICFTLFQNTDIVFAKPQVDKVIVFNVEGEIDGKTLALVRKVYDEANKNDAKLIVMQIDTFGGSVDAATKIRDIIIDSKIKTICFIKHRAWSAGALLALSSQQIAMTDAATIGAAEPIPATEKNISALKAEFAATAAKTSRNTKIAEAMVDKTLGYKNYAKPGQILSLTKEQAIEEHIAEISAQDTNEVFHVMGVLKPEIIHVESTFRETLLGLLINPAVKSFLITLIILGIFVEIKTAGTGVAGIIALTIGIILFGADIIGQSGNLLPILLFILGVGLLVFEIFIPGFGLVGFGGIICIASSFFLLLGGGGIGLKWMAFSLFAAAILMYIVSRYLPRSVLYRKIVLENISGVELEQSSEYLYLINKTGTTTTMMRPSGKINISGRIYDAFSENGFINPHEQIVVCKIQGNKIYVNKI